MEKHINKLIKENIDSNTYTKYLMLCSVNDFKLFQKLIRDKYEVKEFNGETQTMWKHVGTRRDPTRTGTAIFKYANFEINVICRTLYKKEPMFRKITTDVNYKTFWNSKKI